MKLWQLINPLTGEKLTGLQQLPENWGPIFGLSGVKDRLGDLSWLGINDRAWVEVDAPEIDSTKDAVDSHIAYLLENTESKVDLNNPNITKLEFQAWTEYRKKVQEIPLQPDYPSAVFWPAMPK